MERRTERALRSAAKAAGMEIESIRETAKSHLFVTATMKGRRATATAAGTSGDTRAIRNFIGDLRRGFRNQGVEP